MPGSEPESDYRVRCEGRGILGVADFVGSLRMAGRNSGPCV